MNKKNNCAIIVSSFDGYSDAWEAFFTLFFRYWPDCPYPVYLISNTKKYPDKRVNPILIKDDTGWSGNLIHAVKSVKTDYVIYFQEDYFLDKKVNTKEVVEMLDYIEQEKAAYLRIKKGGPDLDYKNHPFVGEYSKEAPYRNSTQAAIWDSKELINLLDPKESGWDFELRGGIERSKKIKAPFLSIKKPLISYFSTAIVKGYYLYDAIKFCEKEGITIDKKARKIESYFMYLLRISGIKVRVQRFLVKLVHLIRKK